jgi:hypothetical protein
MNKIGLVAGCSHIAGSEIDGTMDSEYNRANNFGSLLVDKLGYTPLNIAVGGSANSGIARSVLRWFNENYKPDEMEVFVCIGWTESIRLEVHAMDRPGDHFSNSQHVQWYDTSANEYYRINFGWKGSTLYEKAMIPKYHEFMAENLFTLENWSLKEILMTQYFLKSLNIPFVMCSTMHLYQKDNPLIGPLLELVDSQNYYGFHNDTKENFYWKYKNLGYNNNKAQYWHHNEEPHRLYADELYDFITEKDTKNV